MTLSGRMGLAAVLLSAAVVIAFAVLAYVFFTRQQEEQLRVILEQDLARVTALLDRPLLGASFTPETSGATILQLVTKSGDIALNWGHDELLPPVAEPTVMKREGRTYLMTMGPWPSTTGTVRLAHDITAALASRGGLVRSLVATALFVMVVAVAVALIGARRLLSPLARVAEQARSVDPAAPGSVEYRGPRDEIGDLVSALNASLAAIRQRQKAERDFLLEVAHEIASPLTLVNYHLDAVRRDRADDARLRAAADGARELLRTSQDLLVLARGELESELEPRIVDLRTIVRRVSDEYPDVKARVGEAVQVVGDPERLVQVVRNLVRNAIQSAGRADLVEVSLLREPQHAVLRVCDEGPGMSEEQAVKIFEHGYSGSGGVGVGLTVTRRLVERHGGEIRLKTKIGEGTCFEVRLLELSARLQDGTAEIAAEEQASAS